MGVGLSAIVAIDAQQKLMRLEVHCVAHHDAHLQTLSAATLEAGDVALVFSYNGRIKDVLRVARVAREAGAATVAVTRSGTPLALAVDVAIAVDVPEDTFVYAPMTTRLAQLAVLDVLATGVALRRGPADRGPSRAHQGDDERPVAGRRGPACRRQASHASHQGEQIMTIRRSAALLGAALLALSAGAEAQDKPEKLVILAHKVHQTVATGSQGGDITADWAEKNGVGVEWVTMDTGPLHERMFRELALPETSIDIAFLLNTQALASVDQAARAVSAHQQQAPIEAFEDIFPGLVEAMTFDGELYGVPFRHASTCFHYNERLLQARGVERADQHGGAGRRGL